jgi:peptidoglycan/LPS O-acetylase OafA/YrhL
MVKISNNLDVLRAIAVCYVVLDHSLKFFGYPVVMGVDMNWLGRLGVMFFFVHTCLVLMMSLERQHGKISTARFVGNFYLRRICRIYPLSILLVTIVVLFSIPSEKILGAFSLSLCVPTKTELLLNLALMQNLHASRDIIGVLWSLPSEVQMYLFLPFLFLAFARKGRLAPLFGIWCLGWVVARLLRPSDMYISQFIPGVMAYVILRRVKAPRFSEWLWPLFLAGLTMAFLAWRPSWGTGRLICLVLGLTLPHFKDITLPALNVAAHNIARYSYGIYLSHLFCLWFAFVFLKSTSTLLRSSVFVVLLIGVPVLLFHTIEDPFIRAGSMLAGGPFLPKRNARKDRISGRLVEGLEETASGL